MLKDGVKLRGLTAAGPLRIKPGLPGLDSLRVNDAFKGNTNWKIISGVLVKVKMAQELAASDSCQPFPRDTTIVDASLTEIPCEGTAWAFVVNTARGRKGNLVCLNELGNNLNIHGGLFGCLVRAHSLVTFVRVRRINISIFKEKNKSEKSPNKL